MGHRQQRTAFLVLASFTLLLLACEAIRRGTGYSFSSDALVGRLSRDKAHSFFSPSELTSDPSSGTICPSCSCSQVGGYLTSPHNGHLAPVDFLTSPQATKRDLAQYLAHHLYQQGRADPVQVPESSRVALADTFTSCPDSFLSASFAQLKLHLPTAYAFTRTSGHGRLGATDKRIRYLVRHAQTFKEYHALVEKEGYPDGKSSKDRQLLWIIIEDDHHINEEIAGWLASSGLPYIYTAHGPTRWYGLAQWNFAYGIAIFLRDTLLGDGPIVSVDDDGMVKPELFRRIWGVKKVIAWQVGNFPRIDHPGSTWEGPYVEKGKLVRWHNSWSWGPNRTFPLDMGGFAVNSAVLGPGRFLPGPRFIPDKPYDDKDTSNENEFLLQFYQRREDMELACYDSKEEKCYWTWHNHWLPEDIDDSHQAPLGPDFE